MTKRAMTTFNGKDGEKRKDGKTTNVEMMVLSLTMMTKALDMVSMTALVTMKTMELVTVTMTTME